MKIKSTGSLLLTIASACSLAFTSTIALPLQPCIETFNATALLLNSTSLFGPTIEGTAVNKAGDIFAVGFQHQNFQIGKVFPQCKLFFAGEESNGFNAVRFLPVKDENVTAKALVCDVKNHQVLQLVQIAGNSTNITVFCQDQGMLQPNDLAITKAGRVYLSGQNFTADTKVGDGDLWLCTPDGKATRLGQFGRTNGIEVSPDEKTLYLSEAFNKDFTAISNKVLKFKLDPKTGNIIGKPKVFVDFEKLDKSQAIDIDGMRTDIAGNLYVTRNGGGQVKKFSPKGKLLATIFTNFKNPANLEFGGTTGTDLFIVGPCSGGNGVGCVDVFKNNTVQGKAFSVIN